MDLAITIEYFIVVEQRLSGLEPLADTGTINKSVTQGSTILTNKLSNRLRLLVNEVDAVEKYPEVEKTTEAQSAQRLYYYFVRCGKISGG